MKKYLMTLAAIALVSSAFVSCTKEDGVVYNPTDKKINEYNAAFIARYGKPAADQDWGFGRTRGITRAIQPTFPFPSAPAESDFATEKDPNAVLLDGYKNGRIFYIDSSVSENGQTLQPNVPWDEPNKNIVLYVEGEVKPTGIYTPANTTIYLLPNSKLTIPAPNSSFGQNYTHIYIAENAELVILGNKAEFGNGVKVYNKGVITASNIAVSNNGLLYNMNSISTGALSVENNNSVIVNDGDITATDLNTAGSGKFQNNGSVTISGTTFVNSNNNTWVNNGQYRTGNFIYYATSSEVINNCKLTVDKDFGINLADGNGNFKMDAGSSVVTRNFYGGGNWTGTYAGTYCNAQGGPFYIYMGAGSVFKVTETAIMNASKENYGIYGPESGDFAVFQAKNVVMGKADQGFEVTYGGNLAVVAESHFAQGNDGREDHPFIAFKGAAKIYAPGFEDGLPEINIAQSDCNPGFQGGSGKVYVDRVICEDLGTADDSDFNDVAFDIRYADGGAYFRIVSVGGILPLKVDGHEVHEIFGNQAKADGTYDILGEVTSKEFFVSGATGPADIEVEVTYIDRSGTATAAPASTFVLTANQGQVPQKICVEPRFKLCHERQAIGSQDAYPLFPDYVANPEVKWY